MGQDTRRKRLVCDTRAVGRQGSSSLQTRIASLYRRTMAWWTCSLLLAITPVYADRISDMLPLEECQYRARLASASNYYKRINKLETCDQLPLLWHGDEAQTEIHYVQHWTCYGFNSKLDPIKVGDEVYFSCASALQ